MIGDLLDETKTLTNSSADLQQD